MQKQTQIIESRAPTRIDLAGGTVDIWPLYLFLKNPITLNLAINLYAQATLTLSPLNPADGKPVLLRSEDQNLESRLTWEEMEHVREIPSGLELHFKLVKYFHEKRKAQGLKDDQWSFNLSTRAKSPAGAGLGGSSTLCIAIVGALATWSRSSEFSEKDILNPGLEGENFIEIVRDVETTVIQVPAGLQDYYGAMYGGLQRLSWGAGTHSHEWHSKDLIPELEQRVLLFYSGHSRNSGINNWALFKRFIDRQEDVRSKFEQISSATHRLDRALYKQDWEEVGNSIAEEWSVRKTLATGITTPEIDYAFTEARKLAPISGKVCGAGGGGCFFVYLPTISKSERIELKEQIQKIFSDQGIRPLPFQGVPHGLEVRIKRGAT